MSSAGYDKSLCPIRMDCAYNKLLKQRDEARQLASERLDTIGEWESYADHLERLLISLRR